MYRKGSNADIKERMLLLLNIVYDNYIPALAVEDFHRSRTWV
ncbi:MAG: hypothetical protein R2680_14395 [Nitrososphaeraceae archaeon]